MFLSQLADEVGLNLLLLFILLIFRILLLFLGVYLHFYGFKSFYTLFSIEFLIRFLFIMVSVSLFLVFLFYYHIYLYLRVVLFLEKLMCIWFTLCIQKSFHKSSRKCRIDKIVAYSNISKWLRAWLLRSILGTDLTENILTVP